MKEVVAMVVVAVEVEGVGKAEVRIMLTETSFTAPTTERTSTLASIFGI